MNRFNYQPRTAEQVDARANQRSGGMFDRMFGDMPTFVPKIGDNAIRILPPTWDDPTHYGFDLQVHYGVGPDRQSYLSLSHVNQADPVDEEFARLKAAGNDDAARDFRATRRVGVFLIDRNEEEKGVQLWAMPVSVDKDISGVCKDPQTGALLMLDHPDSGFDVYFRKEGEKLNTRYTGVMLARREAPVSTDPAKQAQWLDFVQKNPLPNVLNFYPYERILEVMQGRAAANVQTGQAPAPAPQPHQPPPAAPAAPAAPTAPAVAPTAPQVAQGGVALPADTQPPQRARATGMPAGAGISAINNPTGRAEY